MFDWGYCEFNMWQTYGDRLREAENERLIRQVEAGRRCLADPLAWRRPYRLALLCRDRRAARIRSCLSYLIADYYEKWLKRLILSSTLYADI
jgi:hypothetical protein